MFQLAKIKKNLELASGSNGNVCLICDNDVVGDNGGGH